MEVGHRRPWPLLVVVLLLAATAAATAARLELEPVTHGGYRRYIAFIHFPPAGNGSRLHDMHNMEAHRAYHASLLPSRTTRDGRVRLLSSYTALGGFSALLTDSEAEDLAGKPGVASVMPSGYRYPQTTRTPYFLGLASGDDIFSWVWVQARYGAGVIVGIVDGGIDYEHPSFADHDGSMPPPPPRWKGTCEQFDCTNKVIGGRNLVNPGEAPDDEMSGHGTHTASTAAGIPVHGVSFNRKGLANGTASGTAPGAHVAVYKVCGLVGNRQRCPEAFILEGLDAAVRDGVDVISLSISGPARVTYDRDSIAVGGYRAMARGVPLVTAAGNQGPDVSSVQNDAPWLFTIGAGTVDRSLQSKLLLRPESSGGDPLVGESCGGDWTADGWQTTTAPANLSYQYDALGRRDRYCMFPEKELQERVQNKVVVCDAATPMDQPDKLLAAGATAVVLVGTPKQGFTFQLKGYTSPRVIQVSNDDHLKLKDYALSSSSASLTPVGTVLGFTPAPLVGYFSGRGPSKLTPGIAKPDLLAPGVNVLAGVPYNQDGIDYKFMSGTSMATPHVAGLLRRMHADWSPAAIRSALMTTADVLDNAGNAIGNEHKTPAGIYSTGAGHVNITRALDPGLVYDIGEADYAALVCSVLNEDAFRRITDDATASCSVLPTMREADLNYPSITVPLLPTTFVLKRTVTNVAATSFDGQPETYLISVDVPGDVGVTVEPSSLKFTSPGQKASYTLYVASYGTPAAGRVYHGAVTLASAKHTVRSPMIAVVDLPAPKPPTSWKQLLLPHH
ncbi:subtilisin-like protease 3 [Panicum virgatum]|uniref:Uncharacterized protein n=1 Tax=Panicum virgatum TaxID=38727 RepID=A0A8T0R1U8_PANVG|nr:subtilisin-like protease 3 [Panicum virgatum]KAG2578973.1 hypothetical protein PVAP13_6NG219800 [Panicum virgatum]